MNVDCPHCTKKFLRSVHLRRHLRTVHEQNQDHACSICGRRFSRLDSCKRHEANHRCKGVKSQKYTGNVKKACERCAIAKARCSGGEVCERCQKQQKECIYLPRVNVKASSAKSTAEHSVADTAVRERHLNNDQYEWPTILRSPDGGGSNNVNWLPIDDGMDLSWLDDMVIDLAGHQSQLTSSTAVKQKWPFRPRMVELAATAAVAQQKVHLQYTDERGSRKTRQDTNKAPEILEHTGVFPRQLGFPESIEVVDSLVQTPADKQQQNLAATFSITSTVYEQIRDSFLRLCGVHSSDPSPSQYFPSLCVLNHYLESYRENFDPHFPLVHHTTIHGSWILALQMVTIGSMFDRREEGRQCYFTFKEFSNRAVRYACHLGTDNDIPLAQACLLRCVQCFDKVSLSAALTDLHAVIRRLERLQAHITLGVLSQWSGWIQAESHVRLLWLTWLVETLAILTTQHNNIVIAVPDEIPLPCSVDAWQSSSAESWLQKIPLSRTPTHGDALVALYIEHKMPEHATDLNKILLTYAIIVRTHEVARSASLRSRDWEHEGSLLDRISNPSEIWLPAHVRYASWRNSACDCLDLIHWTATCNIALQQGFEGPLILHLHMARIFLLCPVQDLLDLASDLAGRSGPRPVSAKSKEGIIKWLSMDGYKSRLGLAHSGAVFWYLRRWSTASFYEPFAIFVATLTVYAYGLYLPQIKAAMQQQAVVDADSDSDDEELRPWSILIDRPCDDELIQLFIRRGSNMQTLMSGAGDICTRHGYQFVLRQAVKILRHPQYACHERAVEYQDILQQLYSPVQGVSLASFLQDNRYVA